MRHRGQAFLSSFPPLSLLTPTHTTGHPHTERGREGREKNQGNQHIYKQLTVYTLRGAEEGPDKKTHSLTDILTRNKRVWLFSEGLLPASDKAFCLLSSEGKVNF